MNVYLCFSFYSNRTSDTRWIELTELDTSSMLMYSLYTNYSKVVLVLVNDHQPGFLKALNINDLSITHRNMIGNKTIDGFFIALANATIPVTEEFPSTDIIYAEFKDAILAGYTITPIPRSMNTDLPLNRSDLTDVTITKKKK